VGVLKGLKYARRLGYRAVELNIDSSAVVQLINANSID
jgi:ribonuclease HI